MLYIVERLSSSKQDGLGLGVEELDGDVLLLLAVLPLGGAGLEGTTALSDNSLLLLQGIADSAGSNGEVSVVTRKGG